MSWDSYVTNLQGQGLAQVAIVGNDGSVWAKSAGLDPKPAEMQTIAGGFSTEPKTLQSNGIIISGTKYMFLRADEEQIQGKQGKGGVAIAKSAQCFLIGIYDEKLQPGNARASVEKMRDYLKGVGY